MSSDRAEKVPSNEPRLLAAGKRFHRDVQAAYVAGLLGVELADASEQTVDLADKRQGRADLLLLVAKEPERQLFIVEIKSTDWDSRLDHRRTPLFRRHLGQLQSYLDVVIEQIGEDFDAVVAALLYPRRPSTLGVAEQLEEMALSQGAMLIFYDEMDWHRASAGWVARRQAC